MLVAMRWKVFELDRYFVPKEAVLNAAAMLIGIALVWHRRTTTIDIIDVFLLVFLGWSALSALFAGNHWLAQRSLAVSVSGAVVFWGARRVGNLGLSRVLLWSATAATVIAAVTSLAQAYGFDSDWYTLARSPGGTLGNRNFIAHAVAIGLPATMWTTLSAKRPVGAFAGSIAVGLLAATLVLSRSRAAWLAVMILMVVGALLMFAARTYWAESAVGGRMSRLMLCAFLGVALAVILPNELDWNSKSPYLDSARNVVDYSSGSGQGRVMQYQNTLGMSLRHPVFGVGPGNWAVRYPQFARWSDKSLAGSGMTANPWPSSDWLAFVSERGLVATLALLGVFATMLLRSLRRWDRAGQRDAVLMKIALAGTLFATMVVTAFDAVLLLPAPAFLAWLVLGSVSGERVGGHTMELTPTRWRFATATLMLLLTVAVGRSGSQMKAMSRVANGGQTAGWVAASRWDPGSYRINQRLAEIYAGRRKCDLARPYLRRALGLFPLSPPARRTARRCGLRN